MRVILCFSLLIFLLPVAIAQNLILNGGFEIKTQCPLGNIDKAYPWVSGSDLPPKVFDTCDYTLFNYFGVPVNLDSSLGYQAPRTGMSYAGFGVYYELIEDAREYLKYELPYNLKKEREYCLTFYVNLVNYSRYAIANIGAFFTDSSLYCTPIPCLLNYKPQVYYPPSIIISDTADWTKISGCFIAKGNEKYMFIGNFTPDSLVVKDTNRYIPTWNWSTMYYIDDVSLFAVEDSLTTEGDTNELSLPNIFSPNADGINDVFLAKSKNIIKFNCKIFNRFGIQISELFDINTAWDGRNSSGEELPTGVYYFYIKATDTKEKELNVKGFVSLMR